MPKPIRVAVMMDLRKDFDRGIAAGIGRFAQGSGRWSLYLRDEHLPRMPDLKSWRGDGVIADLDDPKIAAVVQSVRIPAVGVGGFADASLVRPRVPYVAVDNVAVGRMGAEHLLECGFESFAFCGLPGKRYHGWATARGEAFAARIEEAGYRCLVYTGRHRTVRQWQPMLDDLSRWLERLPRPVGLMACDDPRARHVLEACRGLGLEVPRDVAILGADNDEMMCEMSTPPLSSIELNAEEIGFVAASTLAAMMSGKRAAPAWRAVGPVAVAARESTNTVAVKDAAVARALRFIRDQAGRPIGVKHVLLHIGSPRSTLERRFHRAMGHTIHDEVERVRLETAKRLLTTTDLTVRAVATRSGFRNDNYMGFVFRKTLGSSPGRYRQRTRQSFQPTGFPHSKLGD